VYGSAQIFSIWLLSGGRGARGRPGRRLLAPLRHADRQGRCPLRGEDRKSSVDGQYDAFDPTQTLDRKSSRYSFYDANGGIGRYYAMKMETRLVEKSAVLGFGAFFSTSLL
jgi:hypothetical protein